ncbi:MAG TPA: FtsX-like permease family protein [Pirellulales bacterium]|jgi:ABC-type lipoprotein release transport system permease subunit
MSFFRLLIAGLVQHRRIHLAVALGVAAATAVLAGALVVGDSVRDSLRNLALDRLQRIDEVLAVPRFFRAELANELSGAPEFQEYFSASVPVAMLEGTVEDPTSHRRATHVNILGIDDRFAQLSNRDAADFAAPLAGEISVNEALATELGLSIGSDVIVRLPVSRDVPADSALGRKTETVTNLRLAVSRIIPAEGLGRFALRPNQATPRDAFLNVADLQKILKQPGKVNALLVGGEFHNASPTELKTAHAALQAMLRPRLTDDYGLTIREAPLGYFLLESDRMLFEPAVLDAAQEAFGLLDAQATLTYLANTLADGDREIPYSTVIGIDFDKAAPADGFKNIDGKPVAALAADEIALNSWAADDLQAKIGDTIRMTYFEPESTHGKVSEHTVELRLAAILPLSGPAADPNLTPTLPGVTDQLSISDWNPPFPFDSQRVRPRDEEYWDDHKATPKAFVSLATARKLWGSRFGDTTSLRIPAGDGRTAEKLADRLRPTPVDLGFAFQPVKLRAIEAATGTTPFQYLFLGFSFFIIVAALMLIAILFRLGVEERASEVGLLLAVGWPMRRVRRLLISEGAVVSLIGAIVGAAIGVGYAWLMIAALRTWWLAAIRTPFLVLSVQPLTIVIGTFTGVLISLAVIYRSLARLRQVNVRALLADRVSEPTTGIAKKPRFAQVVAVAAIIGALAAGVAGSRLGDMAQALAFMGSGAMLLVALLAVVSGQFRSGAAQSFVNRGRAALVWLAYSNAARNPGRSTLAIGLIAAASFLIVAIGAFRLEPRAGFDSGTGGFTLVAESDQPIYQDISTDDGQTELGFSSADQKAVDGIKVFSLRVSNGDDASCLNLYQAQQPRVLGLPEALIERGGFAWSKSSATTPAEIGNPWLLLDRSLPDAGPDDAVIPIVLDEATAMYSLHLSGVGSRYQITDGHGEPLQTQVVGLLAGSVLQGSVLMSERDFLKYFPDSSGRRFFLIDTPAADEARVQQTLEKALGDFGFDAEPATERLAEYYSVQNTYLSTFQSLGGLGLLLGTFGLAAVQLRNIVERRAELALLRAAGFRRLLIAQLVLWENAILLVGGLGIGTLAALVAVFPHLAPGGAHLPWLSIIATLGLVLIVGLAAGLFAVRAAMRAPIVATLRGE